MTLPRFPNTATVRLASAGLPHVRLHRAPSLKDLLLVLLHTKFFPEFVGDGLANLRLEVGARAHCNLHGRRGRGGWPGAFGGDRRACRCGGVSPTRERCLRSIRGLYVLLCRLGVRGGIPIHGNLCRLLLLLGRFLGCLLQTALFHQGLLTLLFLFASRPARVVRARRLRDVLVPVLLILRLPRSLFALASAHLLGSHASVRRSVFTLHHLGLGISRLATCSGFSLGLFRPCLLLLLLALDRVSHHLQLIGRHYQWMRLPFGARPRAPCLVLRAVVLAEHLEPVDTRNSGVVRMHLPLLDANDGVGRDVPVNDLPLSLAVEQDVGAGRAVCDHRQACICIVHSHRTSKLHDDLHGMHAW
mmetsp:Transcript_7419/g.30142  ORF Transcript_7419/g.30142 Transcript_7419/m.30142 type:complete len:359 (+) Transcript_7419:1593-2669(+)